MIEKLLSFLLETSFEDLPPEIIFRPNVVWWTGLGCFRGAESFVYLHSDPNYQGAWRRSQATILGTPIKTSILHAALVNGAMSHVLDFDDTHLPALMHPSAPSCQPF